MNFKSPSIFVIAIIMLAFYTGYAGDDFLSVPNRGFVIKSRITSQQVTLPQEFPKLDEIDRVDIFLSKATLFMLSQEERHEDNINNFSVTNKQTIAELYKCLKKRITLPAEDYLSGYASHQNWYAGTNLIIQTQLSNHGSSITVQFENNTNSIYGMSKSFAHNIFELNDLNIDGLAKAFDSHLKSGSSGVSELHSYWEPIQKKKVQHQPAPYSK